MVFLWFRVTALCCRWLIWKHWFGLPCHCSTTKLNWRREWLWVAERWALCQMWLRGNGQWSHHHYSRGKCLHTGWLCQRPYLTAPELWLSDRKLRWVPLCSLALALSLALSLPHIQFNSLGFIGITRITWYNKPQVKLQWPKTKKGKILHRPGIYCAWKIACTVLDLFFYFFLVLLTVP